jgi:hypothetical protein
MKTNSSARRIVKTRIALLWIALAVIGGLEVTVGHTLASRIGRNYGPQTPGSVFAVPSLGIADMMNAAGGR